VVNDYFDKPIDTVNKPNAVLVKNDIPEHFIMWLYGGFTLAGVGLGTYLSFFINNPQFSMIFFIIAGMLWFYSRVYKKMFLVGNFVVATLTALVPFMVLVYEVPLLNQEYKEIITTSKANFNNIIIFVGVFSAFAFLMNLIREIIKDMNDLTGDMSVSRNTIPSVLGIKASKGVVLTLALLVAAMLLYIYFTYLHTITVHQKDYLTLIYFLVFLVIPLLAMIFRLIRPGKMKSFKSPSLIAKGIMISGMLYAVVFYLIVRNNFW
jgi:4-hydroxybenzoate polyprenyltransferase